MERFSLLTYAELRVAVKYWIVAGVTEELNFSFGLILII